LGFGACRRGGALCHSPCWFIRCCRLLPQLGFVLLLPFTGSSAVSRLDQQSELGLPSLVGGLFCWPAVAVCRRASAAGVFEVDGVATMVWSPGPLRVDLDTGCWSPGTLLRPLTSSRDALWPPLRGDQRRRQPAPWAQRPTALNRTKIRNSLLLKDTLFRVCRNPPSRRTIAGHVNCAQPMPGRGTPSGSSSSLFNRDREGSLLSAEEVTAPAGEKRECPLDCLSHPRLLSAMELLRTELPEGRRFEFSVTPTRPHHLSAFAAAWHEMRVPRCYEASRPPAPRDLALIECSSQFRAFAAMQTEASGPNPLLSARMRT